MSDKPYVTARLDGKCFELYPASEDGGDIRIEIVGGKGGVVPCTYTLMIDAAVAFQTMTGVQVPTPQNEKALELEIGDAIVTLYKLRHGRGCLEFARSAAGSSCNAHVEYGDYETALQAYKAVTVEHQKPTPC